MSKTQISLSTAEELGLLPEEVDRIQEILGREPNQTELYVFATMWGEDCSCKNSLLQLKTLPSSGAGFGENGAGLIELEDGHVLAFKMGLRKEVAGIHNTMLSLGAKPIASLSSIRLGDIDLPETHQLLHNLQKGIGEYGNAFGVPAVAGDLNFSSSFNGNPLFNTMSVGISKKENLEKIGSSAIGNPLFIIGLRTEGGSEAETTFSEKRLQEAVIEGLQSKIICGLRHIGEGGITCATAEMAAQGKVGIDFCVGKVPIERKDIQPFEILVSEFGQGMLLEIEKGKEEEMKSLLDKWELPATQIGEITDGGKLRYHMNGELIGEIPAEALVRGGGAPAYEREQKEPSYMVEVRDFDPQSIIEPIEHNRVIRHLLEQVSIAAKKWAIGAGKSIEDAEEVSGDAAFIRLPEMKTAILLSAECNSRYIQADPEKGAMLAVAKAARNITCAGGTPRAMSNSLNFGDPYNPEVYYQFAQSIKGIGAACQQFNTPVAGGNVSLNHESESGPILPTPLIAMLGTVNDAQGDRVNMNFNAKGDQIYLLGKVIEDFASSEYVYSYHQRSLSPAPYINLEEEQELLQCLQTLIAEKAISSAHNVSEGGLIISLLESAFVKEMGFSLRCPEGIRKDAFLYGESGGRAIVSVATAQLAKFIKITSAAKVDALHLGTVAGDHMVIDGEKMDEIPAYKRLYKRVLKQKLGF